MTTNPWSEKDTMTAQEMNASGVAHEIIAQKLGRSVKAINARLAWIRLPPEKKEQRLDKKRKYSNEQYSGRKAKGVGFFTPSSAHPDTRILEERNARLALAPRDLTAAFFGDPLPGYSALEKRT